MYDSFKIKFQNDFSKISVKDINIFIKSFEALLNQHITKNMKDEDKDYFTNELSEKYLIYVRYVPLHFSRGVYAKIFFHKFVNNIP